jgi:endonuclease YncB( thermonuclease family)
MARLKLKLHLFVILPVFLISVFIYSAPAISRDSATSCKIPLIKTALVTKVHKDGLLQLASGEQVRLIGVMPVKLIDNPSSPTAKKLNKLANQAIDILRREVEGKKVELRQSGRARDRYNHLLAHVYGQDGKWLQGILLQAGLARSYSYADNHICMSEMLALEANARREQRGLWRYRIFQPQKASQHKQLLRKHYRFTLVEGEVRKVASVKKWVFLNFGDNWRDDFTIAIKRKYKRKIEKSGLNLEKLKGKKIRVRGWIERWNGPLIKVTHKEQIELLDKK